MRNDNGLTPAERELEAALGSLTPTHGTAGRDRVMFSAGQASIRRSTHLWQGVSSVMAILLLVSIATRSGPSGPQGSPQAVAKVSAHASTPSVRPSNQRQLEAFRHYIRTRRAVLDRGVDAMPASATFRSNSVEPPLTREDLARLLSST